MRIQPSVEELHRLFSIREDGALVRRVTLSHLSREGQVAGTKAKAGYTAVTVRGYMTYAHRVVWAMTHGEWPEGHVDHINGIKADNRPSNLRLATCQQNQHNRRTAKNNALGVKGVFPRWLRKAKRFNYVAQLSRGDGKSGYIGTFDTLEEAQAAYEQAARKLHGEYFYQGSVNEKQLSGGRVRP